MFRFSKPNFSKYDFETENGLAVGTGVLAVLAKR